MNKRRNTNLKTNDTIDITNMHGKKSKMSQDKTRGLNSDGQFLMTAPHSVHLCFLFLYLFFLGGGGFGLQVGLGRD